MSIFGKAIRAIKSYSGKTSSNKKTGSTGTKTGSNRETRYTWSDGTTTYSPVANYKTAASEAGKDLNKITLVGSTSYNVRDADNYRGGSHTGSNSNTSISTNRYDNTPSVANNYSTQSTPKPNRDIASEIVSMLTSGQPIDYNRLQSLTNERDAKMAANPNTYGQYMSTGDLISKYMPQQNNQYEPQVQNVPSQNNQIDDLINILTKQSKTMDYGMSYEQAQRRAQDELNPMYDKASQQLSEELNRDLEKRGIFNSPLASGIMTEKQGMLSNDQIAAIASRANEMIKDDRQLTLQEKQLQMDSLSKLLNTLIGRQMDEANLTGYYNGSPTLANQELSNNKSFQEAQLTGKYNGQQTLASQEMDLKAISERMNNTLNAVNVMGYVATEEQAKILGVPVGTPSYQAQEAAADRQFKLKIQSMQNYSRSLSASKKSQGVDLSDFTKDMKVWETTGYAPNTPAMQYYGIPAGTRYNLESAMTAKEKLENDKARDELVAREEENNFNNQVRLFSQRYGIDLNTAEAMAAITQSAGGLNNALSKVKQNKSALVEDGVDINGLSSTLNDFYGSGRLTGNM